MADSYTIVSSDPPAPLYELTVITICRNDREGLQETLQSVLRQKAKGTLQMEHVVVDGASEDGTPEWLAQRLAARDIEVFVSEQDKGIYDAMNKGINLAHGAVLLFLNSGDTFTEADLRPCVLPILEGKTQTIAACADMEDGGEIHLLAPRYDTELFVSCPCCHQSFFVSAALCRRLGGYDAIHYRLAGDTDFMYRAYRETGLPLHINTCVSHYEAGGLSAIHAARNWPEMLFLYHRCWDMCLQRMREDAVFQRLHMAWLSQECRRLLSWQRIHDRRIPEHIGYMAEELRDLAAMPGYPLLSLLLKMVATAALPPLAIHGRCGLIGRLCIIAAYRFCKLPKTHPLVNHPKYRLPPLSFYLKKALGIR